MEVDFSKVELIAFDLFGTVFKLDRPREEIQAYADHIAKPEWSELILPREWEKLELHEDSKWGLRRIRNKFDTCTMSNAPASLQLELRCFLHFDFMVGLEDMEVFKPNLDAYVALCMLMKTLPSKILMVTANEEFGDLENAQQVGMQSILIDRKNKYEGKYPRTIIELAERAGA